LSAVFGAVAVVALAAVPPCAQAGRPLGTDDAATAPARTCQLESWLDRSAHDHALVLAPACALGDEAEVDLGYAVPDAQNLQHAQADLALKWVPSAAQFETAAGALQLGAKLGLAIERPALSGWHGAEASVGVLASLRPSAAWMLHLNLAAVRDRATATNAGLVNAALAWTPNDRALLFIETLANTRRSVFGATQKSLGGRWWLQKDRLGLDLTLTGESGGPLRWSAGFGWYGLTF